MIRTGRLAAPAIPTTIGGRPRATLNHHGCLLGQISSAGLRPHRWRLSHSYDDGRFLARAGIGSQLHYGADSWHRDAIYRETDVRPQCTAGSERSAPLLIGLHGTGDTAAGMEAETGWSGYAAAHHFIVAYPQGIALARTWHFEQGSIDVAFLTRPGPQRRIDRVCRHPARLRRGLVERRHHGAATGMRRCRCVHRSRRVGKQRRDRSEPGDVHPWDSVRPRTPDFGRDIPRPARPNLEPYCRRDQHHKLDQAGQLPEEVGDVHRVHRYFGRLQNARPLRERNRIDVAFGIQHCAW